MPSKVFSASVFGFECKTVEVEIDILNGLSSLTIVGLPDTAVQESKERILSAIKNSGVEYPRRKKVINLAPADLRKHGPMYDLPIALGLLIQSQQLPPDCLKKTIAVGELSLNGDLKRVSGILPIVMHARENNFKTIIVPSLNADEASIISDVNIIAVTDLKNLISHLRGENRIKPCTGSGIISNQKNTQDDLWHFEDIHGHEYAKRALAITAAGGHNILLTGPPGSGKTLLARSMQTILPPLDFNEAIEVTKIYSVAGKLPADGLLMHMPPFRSVHHTASQLSLIGGGVIPHPGEISFAHNGVLFLDELLEFPRVNLDCLRQPIEEGVVHINRARGSVAFPARFILVAATNPCVCGYYGDPVKACLCTPTAREKYRNRLSGPLLDRMDIVCNVPRLPFEKIITLAGNETSEVIRKKIIRARDIQYQRQNQLNSRLQTTDVRAYCQLTKDTAGLLKSAFLQFHYSGRAYYRLLKVARTIADLEGSEQIAPHHLAEALQYRQRI